MVYERCRSLAVKLGGSVITHKDKPYTVNRENLRRAAAALAAAYKRGVRLVVVHGGGSFGHAKVKEVLDRKGVLEPADVPEIQLAMLELSRIVAGELLRAGVPAVLHAPHTYCRGPGDCSVEPIVKSLSHGLVPVTFGDGVCSGGRVHIVSGDDLMVLVSRSLEDPCAIYVMGEEYVYDENGNPIRVLNARPAKAISRGTKGVDVTGGILRKLESALEAARSGVTTVITGIEGLEKLLLLGEPPGRVGTLVRGE